MRFFSITAVVLALIALAGMAAAQEKPQPDTSQATTETAKPEAVSPVKSNLLLFLVGIVCASFGKDN